MALLYLNGLDNSAMSAIIGSNGVSSLSDAEKTEIVAVRHESMHYDRITFNLGSYWVLLL